MAVIVNFVEEFRSVAKIVAQTNAYILVEAVLSLKRLFSWLLQALIFLRQQVYGKRDV
jgi:hypothetical protein